MTERATTRDRILDASLRLFNEKGYTATTLAEIAASIGIAQGNLTYHFPTKLQLVLELQDRMSNALRAHRAQYPRGPVTDDYVEILLFSMNHCFQNHFLLRDRAQFANDSGARRPDPEMAEDLENFYALLRRAKKEGLFRRDLHVDLRVLARSLWIVSRYWMEHLREVDGLEKITWADQERGVRHHFAILLPCLTASARRDLESSLHRVSARIGANQDEREQ